MGKIDSVAEELHRSSTKVVSWTSTDTHSTCYLNLIIYVAAIRVVVGFVRMVSSHPLHVYSLDFDISLEILRGDWLGLIVCRRGQFTHPVPGIPNLENHIEYFFVDFPRRAPENVEAGVDEFNITKVRGVLEIAQLLHRILETHGAG